ncbi:carboxylate-amine ligase [Bosea sp. CS1GBMeth4]|uniref:carboxylate-amine ligase n=1 Tax=Bosea sp. CS1GBMeth4 TaxID=1892849 RepID=UPI001646A2C1|nr:carboxylate-amine ligase [Bosea sp. CS1GBMeth4]
MTLETAEDAETESPASRPPADGPTYSFGIEEEYFVVDRKHGGIARELPSGLFKALARRFGEHVMTELLQCQVEIATRPHVSVREAREDLVSYRRGIAEIAGEFGFGIIAAGTHPFARRHQLQRTRKRRYERVIADLKLIGLSNAVSGLHVHVEVPDRQRRVEIMYRMIRYLPVLLALSTSSPFWEGEDSGLKSYRTALNRMLPRSGLPEPFRSMDEYEAYVATLVQGGIIPDASYVWWYLRPSLRHPTLELRVSDCCTCVDDTLAIASLYRCLVRHLCLNDQSENGLSSTDRALIDENLWRALRYGSDGTFLEPESGEAKPFRQEVSSMLDLVAADAAALGCENEIRHIQEVICARGTSAHRQSAIYKAARTAGRSRLAALRDVVRWLRLSTEAGTLIDFDDPPD